MNVIFTAILLLSAITLCICAPEKLLPALLGGAKGGAECALSLLCIYAVWLGVSAVAEESGLTRGAARLISPLCRRLFRTDNGEAVKDIAANLSCNLLGVGGAATPYAVRAVNALERDKNAFAQNLLFIINATSIQLVPATVIALRASAGSLSPHDITLPSLIATAISTAVGVGLYLAYERLKKGRARRGKGCAT